MRPAGICREVSYTNVLASNRDRSSTPSRPRHDCPRCSSSRTSALEDRVLAVPESDGKAQALLLVADASDAVLAPVIGAGSGLIVSEVVPGVAVLAVVFPDGSPLALAQIRAP